MGRRHQRVRAVRETRQKVWSLRRREGGADFISIESHAAMCVPRDKLYYIDFTSMYPWAGTKSLPYGEPVWIEKV